MKQDIYGYDDAAPPSFGPPARLSKDDNISDLIKQLKHNKEFNNYLEKVITKAIDKMVKSALK